MVEDKLGDGLGAAKGLFDLNREKIAHNHEHAVSKAPTPQGLWCSPDSRRLRLYCLQLLPLLLLLVLQELLLTEVLLLLSLGGKLLLLRPLGLLP